MSLHGALTAAFSVLFAACVTVGRHIVYSRELEAKQALNYMTELGVADPAVFAAVAVMTAAALHLAEKAIAAMQSPLHAPRRDVRRFACMAALCLLAAWLPYALTVAPGNVYSDSLNSIVQVMNKGRPTNNHHPVFYTFAVGWLARISIALFGTANAGVMVYSVCQTALMILCIVCVLALMYDNGAPRAVVGLALAYYMLIPVFPNYAVTMWKDPLYSCMLLMLSVLLFVLVRRGEVGRTWFVLYAAAGLGTMALRNNGMYVYAALTILTAVLLRRYAKRILISGLAALVLFVGVSRAADYVWSIQGDFVENVGIPLQQLGYAINNDGEFSGQDREYLYKLMPEEVWNYAYRPCIVDTIKWNPQFNFYFLDDTKAEFFGVWFRGLLRNPLAYVKAYLMATYGFWMPGVQDEFGYMEVFIQVNEYGIRHLDLFERLFGFSIMPQVERFIVYIGSGTLLWLCLLGCVLAMGRRGSACAVYLPALLNWGTVMIAAPVAFSMRYVFVFMLGLPLYLAAPLMLHANGRDEARPCCAGK